jgi:hypothetical protein
MTWELFAPLNHLQNVFKEKSDNVQIRAVGLPGQAPVQDEFW